MKKIVELNDTITMVKSPLPFPLQWVNSYLIQGNDGFTLIDPGLHTEEVEQCWGEVLSELQISFSDIEKIVLTHHHPDHYGMTGWFQERTGAPVYLSKSGLEQVQQLWGEKQSMSEDLMALFRLHGMDDKSVEETEGHMDSFMPYVSPQPNVTLLHAEQTIQLGNKSYLMIHTPGHAEGHLCFYQEEDKVIFCGDHVLPKITPNIGYFPKVDENPLQSYLQSLQFIQNLPVEMAYPGHRDPFQTFQERAQAIIEHHHQRLEKMLLFLNKPVSSFQLSQQLFGNRLSVHQLRFAFSETIAHLIYLLKEEKIVQFYDGNQVYFSIKL